MSNRWMCPQMAGYAWPANVARPELVNASVNPGCIQGPCVGDDLKTTDSSGADEPNSNSIQSYQRPQMRNAKTYYSKRWITRLVGR